MEQLTLTDMSKTKYQVDDEVVVKMIHGTFKGRIKKVLPKYPYGRECDETRYEIRGDGIHTITSARFIRLNQQQEMTL